MQQINGTSLVVLDADTNRELPIGEDGYLGHLEAHSLTVRCTIQAGVAVRVFRVDAKKNADPMHNLGGKPVKIHFDQKRNVAGADLRGTPYTAKQVSSALKTKNIHHAVDVDALGISFDVRQVHGPIIAALEQAGMRVRVTRYIKKFKAVEAQRGSRGGYVRQPPKQVFVKETLHESPEDPADDRVYEQQMGVAVTRDGTYTTKFPNNNLWLVEHLGDAWYQLWRVSVVSQDGTFFLTTELMYEPFRAYADGGHIKCPAYADKWPALVTYLEQALKNDISQLPPIEQQATDDAGRTSALPSAEDLEKGTARVLWYSQAEQYGALATPEGNARVHWSRITNGHNKRKHLLAGQLVHYKVLQEPQTHKTRGTGFPLEADGVSVINN